MKIGILGCGYWAPNLIKSLELANCNPCCVADHHIKKTDPFFIERPYLGIEFDAETIINDPSIDAVVIALPSEEHYYFCKKALMNNKHVLVEKPFVPSAKQAYELYEIANKNNLVLMVDHHFIYKDSIKHIKSLYNSGEFGKLYYFNSNRKNLGIFRKTDNVVSDLVPHDLSILQFVLNDIPSSVSAIGKCNIIPNKEDTAYVTLNYENGLCANINLSWICPSKVRDISFGGSFVTAFFDDNKIQDKLIIKHNNYSVIENGVVQCSVSPEINIVGDYSNPLLNVVTEFISCINENTDPISDGLFAYRITKTVNAINESIKKCGKEVNVIL